VFSKLLELFFLEPAFLVRVVPHHIDGTLVSVLDLLEPVKLTRRGVASVLVLVNLNNGHNACTVVPTTRHGQTDVSIRSSLRAAPECGVAHNVFEPLVGFAEHCEHGSFLFAVGRPHGAHSAYHIGFPDPVSSACHTVGTGVRAEVADEVALLGGYVVAVRARVRLLPGVYSQVAGEGVLVGGREVAVRARVRLLPGVYSQMHDEMVCLGGGKVTVRAHERPFPGVYSQMHGEMVCLGGGIVAVRTRVRPFPGVYSQMPGEVALVSGGVAANVAFVFPFWPLSRSGHALKL